MTNELLNKAKAANSPEELIKIADQAGLTGLTEERAEEYFEALHRSGELADEEIDVSAGGCLTQFDSDTGRRCVSPGNLCAERDNHYRYWVCKKCGQIAPLCHCYPEPSYLEESVGFTARTTKYCCDACKFYNTNDDTCMRQEMGR